MGQQLWVIWKHRETGELLGPSVEIGTPTEAVYAVKDDDGYWVEIPRPAQVSNEEAPF